MRIHVVDLAFDDDNTVGRGSIRGAANQNSQDVGRLGIVPRAGPVADADRQADDWGRDRETTERTLECFNQGAVSSVSAMVFMEDSERAAAIALERGIEPFSGLPIPIFESRVVKSSRRAPRRKL